MTPDVALFDFIAGAYPSVGWKQFDQEIPMAVLLQLPGIIQHRWNRGYFGAQERMLYKVMLTMMYHKAGKKVTPFYEPADHAEDMPDWDDEELLDEDTWVNKRKKKAAEKGSEEKEPHPNSPRFKHKKRLKTVDIENMPLAEGQVRMDIQLPGYDEWGFPLPRGKDMYGDSNEDG